MSGGEKELTGPELRRDGVPLDSLADGVPLLGHADDEPVVLVRKGAEVFAVGATCTHYGGPLAEGLVTGDVIRCPWHHACFSLRDGGVAAAPALNPLPHWEVIRDEGRVRVGAKVEAPSPDSRPARPATRSAMDVPRTVVIIGAGAAGSAAAETLRDGGYEGRVVLVDPDPEAPYDRPNLSKDFLAGSASEEWIPLRGEDHYERLGIERVHGSAESIDAEARRVRISDGSTLEYDALLLATGGAPIRPPIPGADASHVHVLRSLADCRALIAGAATARHVVIAGASFIGMEAAASLRARGVEVDVVAPESVPFARTLGEELGTFLRELHESNGVHLHLGHTVAEIRRDAVVLDDGRTLDADLVLLGVGVRPVLDLARSAGIAVENGVLVDERLETSVPRVFAAGDIASYPDPRTGERLRVEHWVVAQRQGAAAARSILGSRTGFESVPFFWTQQYDVPIAYVGHASGWDEVRIDGSIEARDCTVTYVKDDRVVAVATIGRDLESLRAEVAFEGGESGGLRPLEGVATEGGAR